MVEQKNTNLNIPSGIINKIVKIVDEDDSLYKTKTDFIITALREKLRREELKNPMVA